MFTLRIWYLDPVFENKYSFSVSMVRRRISEAQRWQIIDMHTTGMTFNAIGRQIGYHGYQTLTHDVSENPLSWVDVWKPLVMGECLETPCLGWMSGNPLFWVDVWKPLVMGGCLETPCDG
jgi:hypothetical protein